MSTIVDSHCHLEYYTEDEVDKILKRCADNNVTILNNICVEISKFEGILKYAEKYSNVFCSLGTHPCNVDNESFSCDEIVKICKAHNKIRGIGETGLDYFHNTAESHLVKQRFSFSEHIGAASILNMPLIVHTRDAESDTYKILEDAVRNSNTIGVIHCFTGTKEFLFKMLDIGFHISISGIVTFNNAKELQDIVLHIPLDRLLIETDSPYLTPVPMRGKKNDPSFVRYIASFLAKHMNIDRDEFARTTTTNFCNLFGIEIPSS